MIPRPLTGEKMVDAPYELLRAFCLGVNLASRSMKTNTDTMPIVTDMLRQIASGDITLYESPDDENARHLINVCIQNERKLASAIVDELGEKTEQQG